MLRILTVAFALFASGIAAAQVCKYVDSEGRVTYSNAPVKGARKLTCLSAPQPPAQSAQPQGRSDSDATPAARQRVDTTTQRQRDDQRREILESELAAEEQRLEEAKRALTEQEGIRHGDERNYQRVLDRLKPYQDAVAQHEKNAAAIKQELANLR